jgi:DNA transposition AAA+ family ATPase
MAQVLHLAKSAPEPLAPPAFIMTETAQDIMRSLKLIKKLSGPRMTAICGPSGLGKTEAIAEFFKDDRRAWIMTVAAGEDTEKHLSELLCATLDIQDAWRMSLLERRKWLVRCFGADSTVVIDGAQNLSVNALEWACDLCTKAGCDLVFAGGVALNAKFKNNEQLNGRAKRKKVFTRVSTADVSAVARAYGADRDGITGALEGVGYLGGGLNNVMSVLEVAGVLAGDSAMSLGDVRAAIEQLGLSQGGK